MAKQRSNGNGTWKTAFLVAISVVISMGGMTVYYGERIAKVEKDVDWLVRYLGPPTATAIKKGTDNA